MRHLLIIISLIFALCPFPLSAQEIVSVTPAIVTVGTTVTVSGGPFTPDMRIVVGEREIIPSRQGERLMVFTVPPLESGEYAVMLRTDGQVLPSPFTLHVVEPEPRIHGISPANIDECATAAERRITVSGESFSPGARLLLDGAAVPVDHGSETEIVFYSPPLMGGLHHVQVVNPGDRTSLTFGLFVNSIPEIHSVEQGVDEVTYYELTIRGKNFLFNSNLVVDGTTINPELVASGAQVSIVPALQPKNDTVRYIDCGTLVYTRHPSSRQAKRISLQVVNPGGQPSPVYHLTAP
ncbi:MAG TPA: IPT/TIG domain-containing protein [Desulfuromonadales bacterium]|jgi:hypothetical protein